MDISKKEINDFENKLHKALLFGIEDTLQKMYDREIDVEKELKNTTLRFPVKFRQFHSTLNLVLNASMSYLFTEDDLIKKDYCDNIGKDISNKGLEKLDKLFNEELDKTLSKTYDKQMLDMMKQELFSFDFGVKDVYGTIDNSIKELLGSKADVFVKIKKDYFEESIICPNCNNTIIPKSEEVCNWCKGKHKIYQENK